MASSKRSCVAVRSVVGSWHASSDNRDSRRASRGRCVENKGRNDVEKSQESMRRRYHSELCFDVRWAKCEVAARKGEGRIRPRWIWCAWEVERLGRWWWIKREQGRVPSHTHPKRGTHASGGDAWRRVRGPGGGETVTGAEGASPETETGVRPRHETLCTVGFHYRSLAFGSSRKTPVQDRSPLGPSPILEQEDVSTRLHEPGFCRGNVCDSDPSFS